MTLKIDMIGVITHQFEEMLQFYTEVMGFKVMLKMDEFAEFEHDGVRFALSTAKVMQEATGLEEFSEPKKGHSFELAFRLDDAEALDTAYQDLLAKGAKGVKGPSDMPWQQRTAFFADPDGNIHELFTDLT